MKHKEIISFYVKRVLAPQFVNLSQTTSQIEKIHVKWNRCFEKLLPLGGSSEGNTVKIISEGKEVFSRIREAIQKSEKEIQLETYILKPDFCGNEIIKDLIEASKRNVKVTVLYDGVGGSGIYKYLVPIIENGGQVIEFNPVINSVLSMKDPLFRTHRKILVVDNKVAFCGGMNIANEYFGYPSEKNGSVFRDTHMMIQGPAVEDIKDVFYESIEEATGDHGFREELKRIAEKNKQKWNRILFFLKHQDKQEKLKEFLDFINNEGEIESGTFLQVLPSNILRNRSNIQKALSLTMRKANQRILLTSPFFLPTKKVVNSIIVAARNGVDISILTAGKTSDVPLARMASQYIYKKFIEHGVKIYEYNGNVLHSKTVVIDGIYSMVGSYNLDMLSGMKNLEMNVSILSTEIAKELEEQFENDLKESTQVTLESLNQRTPFKKFVNWACYNLSRIFTLFL